MCVRVCARARVPCFFFCLCGAVRACGRRPLWASCPGTDAGRISLTVPAGTYLCTAATPALLAARGRNPAAHCIPLWLMDR